MQQVAASPLASAQAVDPRQLPVPLQRLSRNALIGMGHVWVLHRGVVIRLVAALMVILTAVGVYQARDAFMAAGNAAYNFVQGEFAAAGFGIRGIEITGQRLSSDAHVAALMENRGEIVAGDRVASRLDLVMENCRRLGVNILTTSRGVMTGREAVKAGVGGEVLCNVW